MPIFNCIDLFGRGPGLWMPCEKRFKFSPHSSSIHNPPLMKFKYYNLHAVQEDRLSGRPKSGIGWIWLRDNVAKGCYIILSEGAYTKCV